MLRPKVYDIDTVVFLTHRYHYIDTLQVDTGLKEMYETQIKHVLRDRIVTSLAADTYIVPLPKPPTLSPDLLSLYTSYLCYNDTDDDIIHILSQLPDDPIWALEELDHVPDTVAPLHMQMLESYKWSHPVWLAWCYVYDRTLTDEHIYILHCYRWLFSRYYWQGDYTRAAAVYMSALNPVLRLDSIDAYSKEIIRACV